MPASKYLTHQRIAPTIGSAEVTAQRYHKAPIWCQYELDRLATLLADALAKLNAGPADSDTFAEMGYGPLAPARPLGMSPPILHRFPGAPAENEHEVTVTWHGGGESAPVVEVLARYARVVVECGSAVNVARIRLEPM